MAMAAHLMVAFLCSTIPAVTAQGLRGSHDMHCLSDMTPCQAGQSCCGSCVKAKFGGSDTGLCANAGTWNYSSPRCQAADLPCSEDVPCCGACNPATGKCALQDTWSQTCLTSGNACSDALKCCGSCVYQGADTSVCCQKVVNEDVYPICCDNPDENPHWCKVNGTFVLPLHQLAVAQGESWSRPLVPENPKELTGCGGHKYLHGDWKSEHLVHITISRKSKRFCDLKGDHNSYVFGMPHYHLDTDDRVFPICHSVDAENKCVRQYEKCHVLINAGSGCSAPDVIKKLNGAKWVRYQ